MNKNLALILAIGFFLMLSFSGVNAKSSKFPAAASNNALGCFGDKYNEGKACVDSWYCKCGAAYGVAGGTQEAPTCPTECTKIQGNAENYKIIACGMAGDAPECPSVCDATPYTTTRPDGKCMSCQKGVLCKDKPTHLAIGDSTSISQSTSTISTHE